MEIQIDRHTLDRSLERGASEQEISDTILTGFPIPAKHGRLAKAKVYDFNSQWGSRHYKQKRVEVIYTLVGSQAITVTVYVYYGEWKLDEYNV